MKKLLAAVWGLAILAITLATSVSAQNAECAKRSPMQVGDWFELENQKGVKWKRVITVANDKEVVWRVGNKDYRYTPEMNLVAGFGARTGTPVTYDPPLPRFAKQMCPGIIYGGEFTVYWQGGSTRGRQTAVVGQWETTQAFGGEIRVLPVTYTTWEDARFDKSTITRCMFSPEVGDHISCTSEENATYSLIMLSFGKGGGK